MAGYFAADARIAASGSFIARGSLHEPAVADHQALPGQRVGLEGGERERDVGDVVDGGELAIDGVLEHPVLHHLVLADRSEEHTSELTSLMSTSYHLFSSKKNNQMTTQHHRI